MHARVCIIVSLLLLLSLLPSSLLFIARRVPPSIRLHARRAAAQGDPPPECVGAGMGECGGLDRRGGGRADRGWSTSSGDLQPRVQKRHRAATWRPARPRANYYRIELYCPLYIDEIARLTITDPGGKPQDFAPQSTKTIGGVVTTRGSTIVCTSGSGM